MPAKFSTTGTVVLKKIPGVFFAKKMQKIFSIFLLKQGCF
jgi:hypothetical protein